VGGIAEALRRPPTGSRPPFPPRSAITASRGVLARRSECVALYRRRALAHVSGRPVPTHKRRLRNGAPLRLKNNDDLYQPLADINVTPLVDVMLVLLIIFMITAPLLAKGVKSICRKPRPRSHSTRKTRSSSRSQGRKDLARLRRHDDRALVDGVRTLMATISPASFMCAATTTRSTAKS